MEGLARAFQDWLATRPPVIQALAREFPINTYFVIGGRHMHVLGWNEGDMVLLTPFHPAEDYDAARVACQHVHAQCLRDAIKEATANVQPK